jgi:molybdate transport system substrate-binding protein
MKTKRSVPILTLVLAGFLIFIGTPVFAGPSRETEAKTEAQPVEIIISAAASLTDAMTEAIASYKTAAPPVTVTPVYGSSGSLQQQIEQGAPSDIFFSAAPRQMDALENKGLLVPETRKDMLENKLVLIVPKGKEGVSSFNDAGTDKIGRIALGETGSVPVGQYAEQVFSRLGIIDAVKAKAVYAKDVRQVLAYVEQGEVDAGVVYATDAAISPAVVTAAAAPAGSHDRVIYPAALVTTGLQGGAAKLFLEWLGSVEGAKIFTKYGFSLAESTF